MISVDRTRCTGCSYCVVGCPEGAITLEIEADTWPRVDERCCTRCGECVHICPNNVFSDPALTVLPVALDERYDVVVVGAGIGGLMAAAGLARAGKKVLVLEQLSFVGGKYTHLVHEGYAVTTAAWTCPGPNSRIGRLCAKLGADVEWITIHDTRAQGDHWVVMKDGRRFRSLDEAQETLVGGAPGMASTPVASIEVEDGRAKGVQLVDGRTVAAGVVIHNAGLNRLMQLVGEGNLPPDYVARLRSAVPADVACVILGTNEPLLGAEHSLLHTMGWERTLNTYAPTFFDPTLAPEGRHILEVFWVMEPPFDKRRELDLVLAQLHDVFPSFDQAVELQVPMFFTGLWTAEMAHRMGQSGADRLDPRSPVENLYLVGYDCIGYGMAGDIIPHGVERALYLILDDPAYAPADERASARFGRWLKSQLFKVMALGKRIGG